MNRLFEMAERQIRAASEQVATSPAVFPHEWQQAGSSTVHRGRLEPTSGSGHSPGEEFQDQVSASHILYLPVNAPHLKAGDSITVLGCNYRVVKPITRSATIGDTVGLSESGEDSEW